MVIIALSSDMRFQTTTVASPEYLMDELLVGAGGVDIHGGWLSV